MQYNRIELCPQFKPTDPPHQMWYIWWCAALGLRGTTVEGRSSGCGCEWWWLWRRAIDSAGGAAPQPSTSFMSAGVSVDDPPPPSPPPLPLTTLPRWEGRPTWALLMMAAATAPAESMLPMLPARLAAATSALLQGTMRHTEGGSPPFPLPPLLMLPRPAPRSLSVGAALTVLSLVCGLWRSPPLLGAAERRTLPRRRAASMAAAVQC